MSSTNQVLDDGVVYVNGNTIVDVKPATASRPSGFAGVIPLATGGTIYPGLVELHNHLPYDVLQLWNVPKRYDNRDQWSSPSTPDYHQLISGPMGVLGRDQVAVPAVVRYVELRCLLGGTTTSQGVALASNSGIVRYFKGIVRNVESTSDPALPPADTHIADVVAADAQRFHDRLTSPKKLILHLSEGVDTGARQHFLALNYAPDSWAITGSLIGIHCVALTADDFAIFGSHGGSMVWSPLSNLLLYGKTADVSAALAHGVPVALGSDWAPSGSKNLLGELKVARWVAAQAQLPISAPDLVAMVTRVPSRMLGWDASLGSLEAGKRADLIVVGTRSGDAYDCLIDATESDLTLVVIDGVPRCGKPEHLSGLGTAATDTVSVAGQPRAVNLLDSAADPAIASVSASEAIKRLTTALHSLGSAQQPRSLASLPPAGQTWLALDGIVDTGEASRPHLPYRGRPTGSPDQPAFLAAGRKPLPLIPLRLDPLAAVDNPQFYATLGAEPNLPAELAQALQAAAP